MKLHLELSNGTKFTLSEVAPGELYLFSEDRVEATIDDDAKGRVHIHLEKPT